MGPAKSLYSTTSAFTDAEVVASYTRAVRCFHLTEVGAHSDDNARNGRMETPDRTQITKKGGTQAYSVPLKVSSGARYYHKFQARIL
jgi:hypothetical protein